MMFSLGIIVAALSGCGASGAEGGTVKVSKEQMKTIKQKKDDKG